jgi:choline dehydrogenase-like flavoprotein
MTDVIHDALRPDYIVVGSGAGGGTVAARLAELGFSVVVLEAGGDPVTTEAPGLPEHYQVPAFHALASENPAMSWDFFVHHYDDKARRQKDSKYTPEQDGVLYPRAAALGGCTTHNAMILVCPHNEDWDFIAQQTDDSSWSAANMRQYFERLENCHYHPIKRLVQHIGYDPSRHGWNGWLSTETAIPLAALEDTDLVEVLKEASAAAFVGVGMPVAQIIELAQGLGDPNDIRVVNENGEGLRYTPLATHNHVRVGTRERLLDVAQRHPNLTIITHALATRVLMEGDRAVGVEYLAGSQLYRAGKAPSDQPGERHQILCGHEVILCGGAFNTPQLLMLSGIGPRAELEAHGIATVIDLPGVGGNLQDRYEVGVVNRMGFERWKLLEGAEFHKDDALYQQWAEDHSGVYTTNGAVLAVVNKSSQTQPVPDLFCFALLSNFHGYFPGYSVELTQKHNYLTWAILKAHTQNRGGRVTLRSADPRDPPQISFRYFEEGTDTEGRDLDAVVAGIRFARTLSAKLHAEGHIEEEELPGAHVQSDNELRDFVRDNAWGHHASCTCPIGEVLTSDFRVRGAQGLRVVDASVFPRIPGFFIVCAVYMIAEKAAEVIAAQRG